MKLKNCLPLEIRKTVSAISDDMDKLPDTDNLHLSIFKNIIHQQNDLIIHLLEQTIISEKIPKNPAGVFAGNMSLEEWFNTAGEILGLMKKGEIVIVYDKWNDPNNKFTFTHEVYEHSERVIYVCDQDKPESLYHFTKLNLTIGEHVKIINNFFNRK
tara:strand:+ start:236 stop:706 length:471 start_codon:yes stop_codon:yes gene_type:complete